MAINETHDPAEPDAPRMPFGAHKGKRLDALPSDYLMWLGCLDDLRQPLLGHVLKEMGRRIVEMDRQLATADKGTP
jgi:uncharacterized protein (DUF3820 family)